MKGKYVRTEEMKRKQSLSMKGKISWLKGTKGLVKKNSGSFKKGHRSVNYWKGKKRPDFTGEKHPRWNPDGSELHRIRNSLEYKLWREAVFMRDNYTCQKCFQF